MDAVAADVAVHQGQAGYAHAREIVVVANLPGAFVGVAVIVGEAVVDQGAAAGAIDTHELGVAAELLVGKGEAVVAGLGREAALVDLVVQFARLGSTFILAVNVAKVGAQYPITDRLPVGQLHVTLLVDVFQARVPDTDQGVVVVESVLTTRTAEGTAVTAGEGHPTHAGVVA